LLLIATQSVVVAILKDDDKHDDNQNEVKDFCLILQNFALAKPKKTTLVCCAVHLEKKILQIKYFFQTKHYQIVRQMLQLRDFNLTN